MPLVSRTRSDCPCRDDPFASRCGVWAGNDSLCVCAERGVLAALGEPAPS